MRNLIGPVDTKSMALDVNRLRRATLWIDITGELVPNDVINPRVPRCTLVARPTVIT